MSEDAREPGFERPGPGFALLVGSVAAAGIFAYFASHERPWTLHGENLIDIYPALVDTFHQWAAGRMPVWSGGAWAGYPLIANPQSGAFYPLHAFYLLLTPFPHLRAFDLGTAFHLGILAAGSCLLLLRLGCGRACAGFGGLLSVLAPQVLLTTSFLSSVASISWFPWVIVAAEGLTRSHASPWQTGLRVLVGSLALAAQACAGYPEWALYSGSFGALWILCARSPVPVSTRVVRIGLLASAAILLAAPQLLPAAYEFPDTYRGKARGRQALLAVHVGSTAAIVDPFQGGRRNEPISASPFLGGAALTLAMAAVALRRRRSPVLFGLLVLTGLFALGSQTPVHGWLHSLPVFDRFRGPSKFFLFTQLSTLWLAAMGLQALWDLEEKKRGWAILGAGLAVLVVAEYAIQLSIRLPQIRGTHFHREPELPRDTDLLAGVRDLVTAEPGTAGPPPRVFVAEYHTVVGNLGMLFGIEDLRGASPPLLGRRQRKILHRFKSPDGRKLGWMTQQHLNLYGVDRVLQMKPCEDPSWRNLPVISGEGSQVCVMQNPTARPRYELVTNLRSFESEESMVARMFEVRPPLEIPVLAPEASLPPHVEGLGSPGRARASAYRPGRVDIEVEANCDAMLLVREAWKPGWEARVDDNPVEVLPALGIFFAVPIDAGRHEVKLRFQQPGLKPGLWMACGWLVFAGVVIWQCRNSER
jgi:hypothetical protein